MLILLIFKVPLGNLPIANITISRVCIVGNCWQWTNFTKGPNEQKQHFAELRQKGLPSLDCKKKSKKRLPNSSQTDYSHREYSPHKVDPMGQENPREK